MGESRLLIAGNWKMNCLRDEGLALASALKARSAAGLPCEILVCPPFTLLNDVGKVLDGSGIALGGQDCHDSGPGAHTGDIAAAMLRDAGCSYVIVGHSERRVNHGETDALVRRKATAAHAAGLSVIVCVGETEAERIRNLTFDVLARQVEASLPDGAKGDNTVIAYEPVWAIGTGKTPTADDIAAAHRQIRAVLARTAHGAPGALAGAPIRILYGGSVKAGNAGEILKIPEVDGALVGGASLKADDFWGIAQAAR